MLYSSEYASLQTQLHQRPDYGISGERYADFVLRLSKSMNTKDILDYGCGKCTLQKALPFPIQNYDPFIPEHSKEPHPATLLVCTDVMEHIEPACLSDVIEHISSLTKSMAMFLIATRPAAKTLADGRNAHLIQEPINWWLEKLMPHFDLQNLNNQGGEFLSLWTPKIQKA